MADLISFPFTSATITKNTIFMFSITSVLLAIWMSFRAMSFLTIYRNNGIAPHHVFSMSNWFKVFGINAGTIKAKMVKFFIEGDLLNKSFIRPAVGIDISSSFVSATTEREHSIASRYFTFPNPTIIRTCFINKVQEAFLCGKASTREGIKRICQLVHTAIIAYPGGDYNR